MLNKEVCKRCMETHATVGWEPSDEVTWENKGQVHCTFLMHSRYIVRVKDTPPEECPFAFEHALAGASNEEQEGV